MCCCIKLSVRLPCLNCLGEGPLRLSEYVLSCIASMEHKGIINSNYKPDVWVKTYNIVSIITTGPGRDLTYLNIS